MRWIATDLRQAEVKMLLGSMLYNRQSKQTKEKKKFDEFDTFKTQPY